MHITRRNVIAASVAAPIAACTTQTPSPPEPPRLTWRSGPLAPYAVQEIYPALHDGGIWVAGGFSPQENGATERVLVFDLAAETWRDGPRLPTPSHHVQLASLAGVLYAAGGFLGGPSRSQWICTDRVLKLSGEIWIEGPPLPKPLAEGCPVVHDGRIHLIGGRSPRASANAAWDDQIDADDHFVLAPGATQWEFAAPLPMARNSAAAASIGGTIHVISGRTVANGQTDAHHAYDVRAGRWWNGTPYPEPRGGIAAATFRGRIIAGGGEVFDPESVGNALYQFDNTDGWTPYGLMTSPRHGHGLVAANDKLYAIGGAERTSGAATIDRLDILD